MFSLRLVASLVLLRYNGFLFLVSRLCRVCFPGAVFGGDVFENVWFGFPALLPFIFQLLRLRGELLLLSL